MTISLLISVLGSIVVLAMLTTLVLPNRQTPAVLNAAGSQFAAALRAAMGSR